jgi:hypothetical protein
VSLHTSTWPLEQVIELFTTVKQLIDNNNIST